jgi:ATP-dependent DNA ligase
MNLNSQDDDPTYQQCLYLYDIVYMNGTVLTNLPLRERLERLKEAVPVELKGRVQVKEAIRNRKSTYGNRSNLKQ